MMKYKLLIISLLAVVMTSCGSRYFQMLPSDFKEVKASPDAQAVKKFDEGVYLFLLTTAADTLDGIPVKWYKESTNIELDSILKRGPNSTVENEKWRYAFISFIDDCRVVYFSSVTEDKIIEGEKYRDSWEFSLDSRNSGRENALRMRGYYQIYTIKNPVTGLETQKVRLELERPIRRKKRKENGNSKDGKKVKADRVNLDFILDTAGNLVMKEFEQSGFHEISTEHKKTFIFPEDALAITPRYQFYEDRKVALKWASFVDASKKENVEHIEYSGTNDAPIIIYHLESGRKIKEDKSGKIYTW